MKLLKRRLDHCWFVVTLASLLNRDKDKSLVFVPFQNSLLGLVFLLVPNSEYTMTLQVDCSSSPQPRAGNGLFDGGTGRLARLGGGY